MSKENAPRNTTNENLEIDNSITKQIMDNPRWKTVYEQFLKDQKSLTVAETQQKVDEFLLKNPEINQKIEDYLKKNPTLSTSPKPKEQSIADEKNLMSESLQGTGGTNLQDALLSALSKTGTPSTVKTFNEMMTGLDNVKNLEFSKTPNAYANLAQQDTLNITAPHSPKKSSTDLENSQKNLPKPK